MFYVKKDFIFEVLIILIMAVSMFGHYKYLEVTLDGFILEKRIDITGIDESEIDEMVSEHTNNYTECNIVDSNYQLPTGYILT